MLALSDAAIGATADLVAANADRIQLSKRHGIIGSDGGRDVHDASLDAARSDRNRAGNVRKQCIAYGNGLCSGGARTHYRWR
jgi:hypothetical protein